MKQYLKKNSHLLLILYLAVYFPAFFWVESYITPDTPYTSIYWPLVDDWIPFCEWFILPYYLWALMLVAVGLHLLFADVPAFRRYMYRIMVGFSLSILFFVLFPNGQDLRPASFPRDNFCTDLVRLIYAADTNTNVLPSIHAVGAVFLVFAAYDSPSLRRHRWLPPVFLLLCALICVSTLFVKQHSVLDMAAGVALAFAVYYLVDVLPKKRRGSGPSGASRIGVSRKG